MDHFSALLDFNYWFDENFLDLNVLKTKELVIDFRKICARAKLSPFHGEGALNR